MRGLPERTLTIPAGWVLTDKEVVALLNTSEQRKRDGSAPEFVQETAELYTLKMPVGTAITLEDLRTAITRLNRAAEIAHADVLFTFTDGRLVKRGWITDKSDEREDRAPALAIGGAPRRQEF